MPICRNWNLRVCIRFLRSHHIQGCQIWRREIQCNGLGNVKTPNPKIRTKSVRFFNATFALYRCFILWNIFLEVQIVATTGKNPYVWQPWSHTHKSVRLTTLPTNVRVKRPLVFDTRWRWNRRAKYFYEAFENHPTLSAHPVCTEFSALQIFKLIRPAPVESSLLKCQDFSVGLLRLCTLSFCFFLSSSTRIERCQPSETPQKPTKNRSSKK